MGNGKFRTFQKSYEVYELENLLRIYGFNILKAKKYSDSIAILIDKNKTLNMQLSLLS